MSRDDDDRSPATPDVVDFDALHAALGELPPTPHASSPSAGESQGRSNATYASSRPHAIPTTRSPVDDLDAPAVIVHAEDTVPTGPPLQMTAPMTAAPPFGSPGGLGPRADMSPAGGVPFAQASFSSEAAAASAADVHVAMPTRPRRPRTPTIVMRPRGPTRLQKVIVFVAMLLVFVAGGIAFLVYGKAFGLDIDVPLRVSNPPARRPTPAVTTATPNLAPLAPPTIAPSTAPSSAPSASGSASAAASGGASASPAASGKKPPRR